MHYVVLVTYHIHGLSNRAMEMLWAGPNVNDFNQVLMGVACQESQAQHGIVFMFLGGGTDNSPPDHLVVICCITCILQTHRIPDL